MLTPLRREAARRLSAAMLRRMHPSSAGAGGSPSALRIVSGRLARSIRHAERPGGEGYVSTTWHPDQGVLTIEMGTRVPYAAAHEYGAVRRVVVTRRMRAFFWARYYETGESRFKAMALSRRRSFVIKTPRRAFAAPALEEERDDITRAARDLLYRHVAAWADGASDIRRP